MAAETGIGILQTVALLGTAVIAVPLFRKLGLGSVLGYLAAGLVIGPHVLRVVTDADRHSARRRARRGHVPVRHRPRDAPQQAVEAARRHLRSRHCSGPRLHGPARRASPTPPACRSRPLSSAPPASCCRRPPSSCRCWTTAASSARPPANVPCRILLLEDLAIVPLLAIVALWVATNGQADRMPRPRGRASPSPRARLPASSPPASGCSIRSSRCWRASGAREVMTAAALLVVLGAALVMQWGGLSMAHGRLPRRRAALRIDLSPPARGGHRAVPRHAARPVLPERRHVARSRRRASANWRVVIAGVAAFMLVKALGIYAVARLFGAPHREALQRAAMFAQGGEFAFVLYAAALAVGMFDATLERHLVSAVVILSMALTPLVLIVVAALRTPPAPPVDGRHRGRCRLARQRALRRLRPLRPGRVARRFSPRRLDVSIIDNDVDMIRAAGNFGFKVYYGDGTPPRRAARLRRRERRGHSRLRRQARRRPTTSSTVASAEFPHAKLFVRAFDRGHTLRLIAARRRLSASRDVRVRAGLRPLRADRSRPVERRSRRGHRRRAPARQGEARAAGRGRAYGRQIALARQHADTDARTVHAAAGGAVNRGRGTGAIVAATVVRRARLRRKERRSDDAHERRSTGPTRYR